MRRIIDLMGLILHQQRTDGRVMHESTGRNHPVDEIFQDGAVCARERCVLTEKLSCHAIRFSPEEYSIGIG